MKKSKEPQKELEIIQHKPFPFAKSKTKEINQHSVLETTFPEKSSKVQQEDEDHDCSKCNDTKCKCIQIMKNLSIAIDLAEQNGHTELYDILLTLMTVLQNLENHEDDLLKILETCQEVYKSVNPKEMGCTIN
jgi:hypothetical protein